MLQNSPSLRTIAHNGRSRVSVSERRKLEEVIDPRVPDAYPPVAEGRRCGKKYVNTSQSRSKVVRARSAAQKLFIRRDEASRVALRRNRSNRRAKHEQKGTYGNAGNSLVNRPYSSFQ